MEDVASPRLILDIEPDRQPITGRISIEGLPDRAFAGWLELMSAFDTVCTRASAAPCSEASSGLDGGG